jgi:hypothetical protein
VGRKLKGFSRENGVYCGKLREKRWERGWDFGGIALRFWGMDHFAAGGRGMAHLRELRGQLPGRARAWLLTALLEVRVLFGELEGLIEAGLSAS